jgi:hypothetical protein
MAQLHLAQRSLIACRPYPLRLFPLSRLQPLTPGQKEVAVQCFALRLLSDFTLMYQHCVGVLLKRDTDLGAKEVSRHTMRGHMHAGKSRRFGRSAPCWLLLLAGCVVVFVSSCFADGGVA